MNGIRIYVDIKTGEKMSSIQVANKDIIYWFAHPVEEDGAKWKGIVILASYEFYYEYMIST